MSKEYWHGWGLEYRDSGKLEMLSSSWARIPRLFMTREAARASRLMCQRVVRMSLGSYMR